MNKKFIAGLVAVLVLIGGFAAYNAFSKPQSLKGKILLSMDPEYKEWLEPLARDFEAKNPGAKIELLEVSQDDQKEKLTNQMTSNDPTTPDVMIQPYDRIGLFEGQGFLREFSSLDKSQYDQKVLDNASWRSKTYMAPLSVESLVFYYNKEKLAEANLPKNMDEVLALQSVAKDSDGKEVGLAVNASEAFFAKYFVNSDVFDNGDDPKVLNITNSTWKTGISKLGGYLAKAPAAYSDPKEAGKATKKSFADDKLSSAYISGPWDLKSLKESMGNNLGVASIPGSNPFSGQKGLMLVNKQNAAADDQKLAEEFAKSLSVEGSKTLWDKKQEVPAAKAARTEAEGKSPVAKTISQAFNQTSPMPKTKAMDYVWGGVKTSITDVSKGNNVDETVNKAADAIIASAKNDKIELTKAA
jgi:arabinogalactan oligomer/maltooligosaccharide transport system substrate-binding protein